MKTQTKKPVRYGILGAGWISQGLFMPGVKHTGNSVMTALVTGDMEKAKKLGKKYGIKAIYDYDDYNDLLASGEIDAIYIALPNWMHLEYTVAALKAGIHVLLEKPMAVSSKECETINKVAKTSNAKLMVAYRLHTEPATLAAIARVRKGDLGDPRFFNAVMGQTVEAGNHRAKNGFWAGPVADMGPYPINAARNLFGEEPIEVTATGAKNPDLNFNFHDTVSVTLRFPKERLAQFVVSYSSAQVGLYRITGTKANLEVEPGFNWGKPIELRFTKDGKTQCKVFAETDHFGGETKYFSDCVLNNKKPEPDGEEGLADVRVVEAIQKALESGRPQKLAPFKRHQRPQVSQSVKLPPIKEPKLIDAAEPAG